MIGVVFEAEDAATPPSAKVETPKKVYALPSTPLRLDFSISPIYFLPI